MDSNMLMMVMAFVMTVSVVAIFGLLLTGGSETVDSRLRDLKGGKGRDAERRAEEKKQHQNLAREKLRELGGLLAPGSEKERSKLHARLIQAGWYNPSAIPLFLGLKLICVASFGILGFGVMMFFQGFSTYAVMGGLVGSIFGFVFPSFYIDSQKNKRQLAVRRGLPDAMDVIIICMEGGLSLPASLQRVADELGIAHPLLANELRICQREIQLGKRTGEALKEFANRLDMEELRSLSGVVIQAERYGASLAHALRIHADSMRQKRAQRAEEEAHKAGTKILIPTLLFIFPGIFVVVLGPGVIRILGALAQANS